MGACKEELTPKTTTEEPKSKLGFFKSKKKESGSTTEDTLADLINKADQKLSNMILVKESDLKNERNQEEANRIKLSKLRAMAWHLDQLIEIAADY
jgi:hypothetical protein